MTNGLEFVAVHDEDAWADDPRGWDSAVAIRVFNAGGGSGLVSGEPVTGADAVFVRLMNATGDIDVSARGAARAARLLGEPDTVVTVQTLRGYSQRDWWDVVAYGPDEGAVAGMLNTFGMWLRGDVYCVEAYRVGVCDHGEPHRTYAASMCGVYADSEDEAIECVRADLTLEANATLDGRQ